MTICSSFEILFLQHFLYKAVIDSLKHLWNKQLKNKRKKDGLRGIFVFNFRLLSLLRFHENASVLFCIFDIFNNYGLKSGQKNTGEAVLSRSPSYNFKKRNQNSKRRVGMRSPL